MLGDLITATSGVDQLELKVNQVKCLSHFLKNEVGIICDF